MQTSISGTHVCQLVLYSLSTSWCWATSFVPVLYGQVGNFLAMRDIMLALSRPAAPCMAHAAALSQAWHARMLQGRASARLEVEVEQLGGRCAGALERGLELHARRALGAGRDELQPVRGRVVHLRTTHSLSITLTTPAQVCRPRAYLGTGAARQPLLITP